MPVSSCQSNSGMLKQYKSDFPWTWPCVSLGQDGPIGVVEEFVTRPNLNPGGFLNTGIAEIAVKFPHQAEIC